MANMCRSRTGDWSVVIGPGLALALGLLYIFVYIFSFSSLVRVVANLRRCLHYHIKGLNAGRTAQRWYTHNSHISKLGLWLRLECSLDCIIYVSEGFDVPRDYRSRRGRETIKRYDVTETYSHVVRQNLSETSITCAESG